MAVGDVLKHWQTQIGSQVESFAKQADKIASWDKIVRLHTATLSRLSADVGELKGGQRALDAQLEAIEGHQRTMDETLSVSCG